MKGILFGTASILVLTSLASPAGAQGEQPLWLSLENVNVHEEDLNAEGRLPTFQLLHIDYSFKVNVPAFAICPFKALTITFEIGALPTWATGVLSVKQFSFMIDQQNNLLNAQAYGPFTTTASVLAGDGAPSGALLTVEVRARAPVGGPGTAQGCNLRASDDFTVAATVQIA